VAVLCLQLGNSVFVRSCHTLSSIASAVTLLEKDGRVAEREQDI